MEKRDKIFRHAAHHEAMQPELHEYADALEFQDEYPLSKEALRMDSLIIKKTKNIEIKKNIGRIFKGHNLVEFKSESDSLRSNLNLANVKSFMQEERTQSLLNEKSVLMDRIIKANPEPFKEAFNMHTEALRNFFLEHAEENGWLDDHDKEIAQKTAQETALETARETAREMLRYDIPPDKVAKITKLPLETVLSLSTELDPLPAGA